MTPLSFFFPFHKLLHENTALSNKQKASQNKKKVLFLFELFQAVLAKFFSYAVKVRNTQLKCLKNMFKKC